MTLKLGSEGSLELELATDFAALLTVEAQLTVADFLSRAAENYEVKIVQFERLK